MKKNMQTILIIIFIATILGVIFFLALSKKCVTYSDSAGNKSGGCFYIWQKGWWSRIGNSVFVDGYFKMEGRSAIFKIEQGKTLKMESGELLITLNNMAENSGVDITASILDFKKEVVFKKPLEKKSVDTARSHFMIELLSADYNKKEAEFKISVVIAN